MATKYEVRTFEDIYLAILEELGEQSSNTKALNRLKRDINAVYLNEVCADHNFKWLERTVEVQTEPYFSTGTVSVTANSSTITLTESPAKSYRGYLFATEGHQEVYRILSHTAGSSTVVLESPFTGSTDSDATFKIWSDFVPLPPDAVETLEVSHAYSPHPLSGQGSQEFDRVISQAPRAMGRPKFYSTGEKRQPTPYESVSSLPATLTRSASGRIRTIVFASTLGADDATLLIPGRKIEVSGAGSYTYNGESVVAAVTTTTVTNDTISYTVEENLTQSSTSDTGITVKAASNDSTLYEYRPLHYYPAVFDSRTTLKVRYKIEPTPLVEDDDEPLMPAIDRMVLVYGGAARGWAKSRDEQTADRNEALFQRKLAKMAGRISDSLDKPRFAVNSQYLRSKRRRQATYSLPSVDSGGLGGSASQISGTASRAAIFDSSGHLVADPLVSTTELEYLDGVTSNIQTQLNNKLGSEGTSTDNALIRWDGSSGNSLQDSAFSVSDAGAMSGTGSIAVDNLKLDGNTLSSTDTNGDINLTPDGTGKVRPANLQVTSLTTGVAHVDADGDITSSNIVNADVDAAAAIDYSKLNLTGSIVNADVAGAAAIARSKIATGTADRLVVNANGTGALSDAAAITASRALISDANGIPTHSAVTSTTLAFLDATSSVQTQLDAKIAKSTFTTKGDILATTAASSPTRLAVGSDGQFLKADSAQATGLAWASATNNLTVVSKTANYTVTTSDDVILVNANSGGASFTLTLFAASGNSGKKIQVIRTDNDLAKTVTIDGNASETINGATTILLHTQYESYTIVCDGSNWHILDHKTNTPWTSYTMTIGATTSAPTKGTTTTDQALWRRNGSAIDVRYTLDQSGAGSAGTGDYLFPVPTGLTIDTSLIPASTSDNHLGCYGTARIANSGGGTTRKIGNPKVYDSSNLMLIVNTTATDADPVSATSAPLSNADQHISFTAIGIPISGWTA